MNATRSIPALIILLAIAFGVSAEAQHKSTDEILRLIDAAEPRAVVVVPPGVYQGNLVLDKPIELDGQGLAILDGGGKGNVVELLAANITIRGFVIRNSGKTVSGEPCGVRAMAGPIVIENNRFEDVLFGIDLRESPDSIIRDNVIHGKDMELGRRGDGIRLWWSHNCIVERNEVNGLRDMVFWYSENLTISQNHVTNSRYGLHFMYSHNTILKENQLSANSVGIYLMYSNNIKMVRNSIVNNRGASGYGIGLKDCDGIIVENNDLLANRVGIYLDNSPSSVDSTGLVTGNMVAFNEIGLLATPITHDNTISHNVFIENEEQVSAHGGGKLSRNHFSADGIGNFWSNYAGFDKDDNGIGDIAYEPRSLFRSLLAREPNLRIFLHSPAQQAIELTARAFPDLRPEPMFVDPAPLTRLPQLDLLVQSKTVARTPMALLALGLLLGAGAGGWMIARQRTLPASVGSPANQQARKVPA